MKNSIPQSRSALKRSIFALLCVCCLFSSTLQVFALAPPSAFEGDKEDRIRTFEDFVQKAWIKGRFGLPPLQEPPEQLRTELSTAILNFQAKGTKEFLALDAYSLVVIKDGESILLYLFNESGTITKHLFSPKDNELVSSESTAEEYVQAALRMREDSVRHIRHFGPPGGYGPRDNPLIVQAQKAKNLAARLRWLKDADAAKRVAGLLGVEEDTGYKGVWDIVIEISRSDPDMRVRKLAASCIAKNMHWTADPILEELDQPALQEDTALWWTRLLAWRGGVCSFALASLLVSDNKIVRQQALKTLLEYHDPDYLLMIYAEKVRNPGNTSPKEFQGAIAAVGYLGRWEDIPLLKKRLMDKDMDLPLRETAAKAIFQICHKINDSAELFLVENDLKSAALNPTHRPIHRVDALLLWESLIAIKMRHQLLGSPRRTKLVDEMMTLLADEQPDVCRAAEHVLTNVTDHGIAELIQKRMRDANIKIRAATMRMAIKIWTSPGTIMLLLDGLQDKESRVRDAAVDTLGKILYEYLREEDETGRLSRGIGRIAATPFLPDKMLSLRRRAVDVLGLSGNRWALGQLALLRDFPELRRGVYDALETWKIATATEARRIKLGDRVAQKHSLPTDTFPSDFSL